MHQGRRLESVPRWLPSKMTPRHAPQLVIHQRNKDVECRGVSLAP
jgi:hypothetical protein